MASIMKRGNKYCVIRSYVDKDNHRHQKWETYLSKEEAKRRCAEIEYKQQIDELLVPECKTISELISDYISLYGKTKWSLSAYTSNISLFRNYIEPELGKMQIRDITPRVLEKYYQKLLKTPSVHRSTDKKHGKPNEPPRFVTPATIRKIHNLLRSMFTQAEKWELVERNPAKLATVPKNVTHERAIWDAKTIFHALELCDDPRLKLCINLSFACSLRLGEVLGLTWDCVDIDDEKIKTSTACIHITKQLQRVSKTAMDTLDQNDILKVFPEQGLRNSTILVFKKPKTITSVRKIFLPKSVAMMLVAWKMEQDALINALGADYIDNNLVIASPLGMPLEGNRIRDMFQKLIKDNDLPNVVFHSLRHSSITYKLRLNGGDIKAVQGDSGHAQAQMVTDQYSHILDEGRQNNALLFEEAFYANGGEEPEHPQPDTLPPEILGEDSGISAETLGKLLGNPEVVNLLKALTKAL